MNFIEVYTTEDRDKLIEMGYKLIKSTEVYCGQKYTFANPNKQEFKFDNMKVYYTNQLTF